MLLMLLNDAVTTKMLQHGDTGSRTCSILWAISVYPINNINDDKQ